jgi:predicted permease
VQGDLLELYGYWTEQYGEAAARRRYVLNVLVLLPAFGRKRRLYFSAKPLFTGMLKSYFTIAFRNLARRKIFSAINISGLSIGLACCMLIFLYTKDEISYDRFHENGEQLYQITVRIDDPEKNEPMRIGVSAAVHGPAFKGEIPEVAAFVRVKADRFIVKQGDQTFEQEVLFVNENFFSVFSFPLLVGHPQQVLAGLNTMVLSEEAARRYFGRANPVGQTLQMEIRGKFEPFVVTGVARNAPQNSTLKFSALLPYKLQEKLEPDDQWNNLFISTFLLLRPDADVRAVEAKMARVFASKVTEQFKGEKEMPRYLKDFTFGLQPLVQMHLSTEYPVGHPSLKDGSNPVYAYILTGLAGLILLIACINFVNLTVAQSLQRAKEIGIRKVVGGRRSQLVGQFLGESFVLSFLAFLLALGLAYLALPLFNQLANKQLSLSYLLDGQLVAFYLGLFLLTGLAAGFYPALVLSGFDPVQTLYKRTRLAGKNYLAKSLVVVQFMLATFLITAALFMYAQFEYLTGKELGYNDEGLVVVPLGLGPQEGKKLVQLFKAELSREPGVLEVAAKSPGGWLTSAKAGNREVEFSYEHIDDNYLPALRIPLVKGRNFSAGFPADSTQSVLINEAFAREAGWKDPIGQTVDLSWKNRKLTVVGVVKDYHFASLKEKIRPQVLSAEPELGFGQLYVKIRPGNTPGTLKAIQKTFRQLIPFRPFRYEFMDDLNARQYEAEARWKQIITLGALLTIFISCIGLFGLTALTAERRTKEVGIRKVLGASSGQIVVLLSADFLLLVLLAFGLAAPAAWYATNQWLQEFAYRINPAWWGLALAGSITLVIALLTIGAQSMKAALANPANSLRSE